MNIPNRIRKIREHFCNGSNKDFAGIMEENPSTTSNWVNRDVGLDVVEKILLKFPSINSNWLITGDGDMLKPEGDAKVLNNPFILNIPLVGQYAQAGYLSGFADDEYVETLPTIPFIGDRQAKGEYVAFEARGDSMENGSEESIIEGDILIGKKINQEHWRNKLHINKWDFIIVHKTDGILVKRIIKHDIVNCVITIHSLNEIYPNKEIHLNDVSQLFNVVQISRSRRR